MSQGRKSSIAILHHLRWISALLVAYSHIRQNLLLDYTDLRHPGILGKAIFAFANFGHAGVIIFFVLSGYLVGGKAIALFYSDFVTTEWPHFLADRFSRIFMVLWPALLCCFLLLLLLHAEAPGAAFMKSARWGWAMPNAIDGDFSSFRWLNAIFLLNEFNSSTLDIDSPLWSLAYEWFYYMAALGAVLALRKVFSPASLLVICYAAALFLWALIFHREILYLGLVWLMGAVANIAFKRRMLTNPIYLWAGIGLFLGLLGLMLIRFMILNDLVLGTAVAFLIAHRNWAEWRGGEHWGEKLSAFSYSFYVVHFPITILVLGALYRFDHLQHRLALDAKGIGIAVGTLAGAIVFARIFAFFTEKRTRFVRNLLWPKGPRQTPSLPQNANLESIQEA